MIVPIDDILNLIKTCPHDFIFIPIEDMELKREHKAQVKLWEKGNRIPEESIQDLKKEGIEEIDLLFSNSLYKMLNILDPQRYKDPSALKTFIEIDKIINTFKHINRMSKRQRHISFLYEMYNLDDAGYNPVIRFNEMIDDEKWNFIKTHIKKAKKDLRFPILYNEIGIIIFVDLTKRRDNNYIGRFKKNADLCSLLVQRKEDNIKFNISPEFNQLTDVWAVNEPEKLLAAYIEKNARLIVVGDALNDTYRSALMEVKKYDKFARFFVANNVSPGEAKALLMNIKMAYHTNNYTFE